VLDGVTVLVAGAGLAGLAAAHDLVGMGASVTVVDPRDRVGGRVWTIRNGFVDHQHGEAGGDLIDESHHELRRLAESVGLTLSRILRRGWGQAGPDAQGRVRAAAGAVRGWERLSEAVADLSNRYRLAEQRWDSPITADIARRSVSQWLDDIHADAELRTTAVGLRGFFLADPEELSLLALVDQFASSHTPASEKTYRIDGGNDRLATVLAEPLGERLHLATELVAVSHRGKQVRASLKHRRVLTQATTDFLICTLPASLVRRLPVTPALPPQQHQAIAALRYGRATKSLLQFSKRFWRQPGRPSAFGTPMSFGAVWDANEEQRGTPGILTLLAGGAASDATNELIGREGVGVLSRSLDWLGSGQAELLGSHHVSWDADPFARGGYAFFDPSFPPALRSWLAQPCGRIFFAGEHTSHAWQGYMNGAVQSGRRAAAEILATHRLGK
jgi:monoamine oxidase